MNNKSIDTMKKEFEEVGIKVDQVIHFDRKIETEEEMFLDPVYTEIFAEFVNSDMPFRKKYPSQAFSAFVSGDQIWTYYTIDGIKMFREVTLHTCLSDAPNRQVFSAEDGALITNYGWSKTMSNRKELRRMGITIN